MGESHSIVEEIAGVTLERRYKLDAPQGVRGRNSDNEMIRTQLGWEPSISLDEGLRKTYVRRADVHRYLEERTFAKSEVPV